MNVDYTIKKKLFSELSLTELFEIVRARFDVFVGEQHILEPELKAIATSRFFSTLNKIEEKLNHEDGGSLGVPAGNESAWDEDGADCQ